MISLVFDTETTGLTLPSVSDLEKQPRIIEMAVTAVEDGVVLSKTSTFINPGQQLSKEINKITGIHDEDLVDAPTFKEAWPMFSDLFEGADIFWAHNMPFDEAMLSNELRRAELFDAVLPLAACSANEFKHELGYVPSMKDLYEKTLGRPLEQTHRAQDDVDALVEILLKKGVL